jgi:futalosine hydrolase
VLGKVVTVREELIGDAGVEEQGNFKDLGDLQLQHPDIFPFTSGRLVNKNITHWNVLKLDEVRAITVNEISTRSARIQQYKEKYNPETESMEGGSLHYCCIQTATPFIQIRAVSNYVGDRDKSNWNFKDSLNNLTVTIVIYIKELKKFYN